MESNIALPQPEGKITNVIRISEGLSAVAKAVAILVAISLGIATVTQYPDRLEKLEENKIELEERLNRIEQKQRFSLCVTMAQMEKTDWSACKFLIGDMSDFSPPKKTGR